MSNPFCKNKILDAKEYIEKKQIRYNTVFFKLKENKCLTKHNSKKHQKLVRAVNQKHKLDLHKGYFLTQNKCFKQECRPVNMNDGKNTIVENKNCKCKKNSPCMLKCNPNCREEKGLITPQAYLKYAKKTSDIMLNQTNHMQFYYEECVDSQKCCMCKCEVSECICENV
jgi:hypothetical protein